MSMTARERFEAVLEGGRPDRISWTPRLDIWYEHRKNNGTLPGKYAGRTLEEIRLDLGADMSARKGKVHREAGRNFDVKEEKKGGILEKSIITPSGTVREKYRQDPKTGAMQAAKIEHFIKEEKDYRVLEHVIRNTDYEPTYDEYMEYEKRVGARALPLCHAGDVPFTRIIRDFIGYNRAFYELHDNRKMVEGLHEAMLDNYGKLHEVLLGSPGKLFLHGLHFDSMMTPPPIFREYILPYLKDFCAKMEAAGKWVAVHQDADASLLLDSIREAGVHAADCLCTHPMVPLRLEDALEAWEDEVVIWGGIPSTVLCPELYGDDEFRKTAERTVSMVRDRRVILAVADNVMPEADIERVRYVSELVRG